MSLCDNLPVGREEKNKVKLSTIEMFTSFNMVTVLSVLSCTWKLSDLMQHYTRKCAVMFVGSYFEARIKLDSLEIPLQKMQVQILNGLYGIDESDGAPFDLFD